MAHCVCPWWMGYVLVNPLRRLAQDPRRILGPVVREGMIAIEPGPGLGFFTLELARRVGTTGRVVAVDIQPRMLKGLEGRVRRAGLSDRVQCRLVAPDGLGLGDLEGKADFALVFAVVHEVPDPSALFRDLARALKPGGRLLLSEPSGHVSQAEFDEELRAAASHGLAVESRPEISRGRSALLVKSAA